jgi:hypothetical protein
MATTIANTRRDSPCPHPRSLEQSTKSICQRGVKRVRKITSILPGASTAPAAAGPFNAAGSALANTSTEGETISDCDEYRAYQCSYSSQAPTLPQRPRELPWSTHLTHLRVLRLQQWRNGCARKRRANELAQHVSCNTLRARLEKRGRDERSASSKRGDYCMVHEGKSEPSVCRSSRFKGEACGCSRKIATNRCNAIEVEV